MQTFSGYKYEITSTDCHLAEEEFISSDNPFHFPGFCWYAVYFED